MTIVTHALATTLGVRVLKLTGSDVVLAYVFGVGVDIDHAIKAPFYLRTPWYQYSPLVTQGFLVGVSDKAKEAILIVILLCTNLLLFLAPL
ncbi:MAG: hypothetical protein DMD40_14330 [Gemmatimonadetes bacterium]|nr:MAG: hypothetical protein DMD40_14330 [Gemmatimonadota bacterium]